LASTSVHFFLILYDKVFDGAQVSQEVPS